MGPKEGILFTFSEVMENFQGRNYYEMGHRGFQLITRKGHHWPGGVQGWEAKGFQGAIWGGPGWVGWVGKTLGFNPFLASP